MKWNEIHGELVGDMAVEGNIMAGWWLVNG